MFDSHGYKYEFDANPVDRHPAWVVKSPVAFNACCSDINSYYLFSLAGEKPHVCAVCNKGFSTSSSLNTHRRIHSGEKPHQCGVCGKRFTASSNLYYHRMTHIKVST